ncbi:MAG: transposase [Microcystis sp. LE17-20D]|nr:transposase [Microcystis sp. LE17-20D]MCZ8068382.1 transposase [Microcystis sp. LE17-20D]
MGSWRVLLFVYLLFIVPHSSKKCYIIIDNASFHPKQRIKKLLAKAGCEVLLLPAYSPDLNKIEKFWARLKNYVSQIINDSENLVDAVSKAFRHLS